MVAVWVAMLILALRFPAFALPITWVTFAFEQVLQSYSSTFLVQSWLWNVITALAVGLIYVIAYMVKDEARRRLPQVYIWTLVFLGFTFFSILWSADYEVGLQRVSREGPQWLVCLIAPACLTRNKDLEYAILGLIILGSLVLLGNYWAGFGARGVVLDRINGRTLEGNPLAMASFANIVGLAALFSVYRKSWPIWLRLSCLSVVALAVFIAIRTGSRGQVIGFFLTGFLWSPVLARKILRVNPIPALVVISMFLWAGSFFLESVTKEAGWGDRYSSDRLSDAMNERVKMVDRLFQEYVTAGPVHWMVGLGNSTSFSLFATYPHVTMAETLCEEGIIGIVMLVTIVYLFFKQGFALLGAKNIDQSLKLNAITILAALSFEIAISFKEGSLLGASNMFSFGLVLATMYRNAPYEVSSMAPAVESTTFFSQASSNLAPRT